MEHFAIFALFYIRGRKFVFLCIQLNDTDYQLICIMNIAPTFFAKAQFLKGGCNICL